MKNLLQEYTPQFCKDKTNILKDGKPMTMEELLSDLRTGNRAKAVMCPRFWSAEINKRWCTDIPDLIQAFENLRKWVHEK